MGNEHNHHHKLKSNSDKRSSKDDTSVVIQRKRSKISLEDDDEFSNSNRNNIQPSNNQEQTPSSKFNTFYSSCQTQINDINFIPQQKGIQSQTNTNAPHKHSCFNQYGMKANQQQHQIHQQQQEPNMTSYNDYFVKVQQSQTIPQNDKVTKDDLHLIKECIKKCDEKYQQGCIEITKNNNYSEALELFVKTKTSLMQLLDIIKSKHYLPLDFVQNVTGQLNDKIAFTSEAVIQCNTQMLKQQVTINNTNSSKTNINTNNYHKNAIYNKEIYKSQFIQPNKANIDKRTNSNPQKKRKGDDETNEAFEAKIESEILVKAPNIKFEDIVGMKDLKQIIYEIVVMPTVRPDLFIGLRKPQRGLLLFGPPGTGKTMIAKAIAGECSSTFFNISASSLTSKWIGESEKTVRALFQLAYKRSPAIIFIDEIESVLSKRSENDNDASKRLKTEFLIQFDGLSTNSDAKLLVIAATNRPMDLDDALLRRLPKKVYCGPLDLDGRKEFIKTVMKTIDNKLSNNDIYTIAMKTDHYSNSDLKELCREAAYQPVRELSNDQINKIKKLRPIVLNDFIKAINSIRGTITIDMINELDKWNSQFGVLN